MSEPPPNSPSVSFRAVLASAIGVWTTYFILVTLRNFLIDDGDLAAQFTMMGKRSMVCAAGVVGSLVIWLVLRRMGARPLWVRIATVMLLALPASLATAWVNYEVFSDMDKSYSLLDDGRTRITKDAQGNYVIETPGRMPLIVNDPHHDDAKSRWQELTDIALGRYFLLIAWGALYLALANATAVRDAERREAELRRAAKAAELRSLRYQVNPHFLFNTLNSLSALVLTGKTAAAEQMIQSIATFYRTSLTGDATVDVPLSDEVRLQELYLEVEGVRFPTRLKTQIDVPDALAGACVPGLILQPLVENAVKHAVAATTRPVTIRIAARTTDTMLLLTVIDDGPGTSSNDEGCGIGLTNVRDRLRARFGEAATMDISSHAGFAVTLTMPISYNDC
ncbi:MAG: histidine kinase [Sphingomonadales bacterium]